MKKNRYIDLSREWLKKADNDLELAKLVLKYKPNLTDGICFHCQQAVEKYLKAILTYKNKTFKKTHSLVYLLDLLDEEEDISDEFYSMAEELEGYSVEVRYPDAQYIPSEEDAAEAVKIAQKIKEIITNQMGS